MCFLLSAPLTYSAITFVPEKIYRVVVPPATFFNRNPAPLTLPVAGRSVGPRTMRCIAFRRILPIVQLALFVALILVSYEQDRLRRVESENTIGWDLEAMGPLFPMEVCLAINAPAVFVALAPIVVLDLTGSDTVSRVALLIVGGISVALLWYVVGLWIDRRLGLVAAPPERLPGTLRGVFGWTIWGILVCATAVFSYAMLYRDAMPHARTFGTALAAWTWFLAVVALLQLLRWRPTAR